MFREVQQNKVALEIVSQIREAILSGTLNPGDRLPPERALVSNFGVSKHSLREAMRALEAMGFIEVRKGSTGGAVVLEVDMKTTRESIANFLYFQNVSVRDLSEVRKVIEPHLARLASERLTSEELDDLEATHKSCLEAMTRGAVTYHNEIAFHGAIARASGNPVFMLIQDFVNSLLADSKRHIRPGPGFLEEVISAHDRILAAIRARDSELAATEMYGHVCQVENSLEGLQRELDEAVNIRRRGNGGRVSDRAAYVDSGEIS